MYTCMSVCVHFCSFAVSKLRAAPTCFQLEHDVRSDRERGYVKVHLPWDVLARCVCGNYADVNGNHQRQCHSIAIAISTPLPCHRLRHQQRHPQRALIPPSPLSKPSSTPISVIIKFIFLAVVKAVSCANVNEHFQRHRQRQGQTK